MYVSIEYSFSWIRVYSGDTRTRHPQPYVPEMRDPPHNRSSLETEVHSVFIIIKGKELRHPFRTQFIVLKMLMNDGVNRFFTKVEFVTDVTGPSSSIGSDYCINGDNRVISDHDV
ncbi:uncharacterized protein NPIL_401961 [Nephila pilipes]|uniref:Uncharacterized protein n=1 Tax=Nephila pilipes TaxID=299642 RepID=A0A8X6Q5C7_NEPPI|nr:uncharacterized protein NPIL_401961 [Nephila pilipes]